MTEGSSPSSSNSGDSSPQEETKQNVGGGSPSPTPPTPIPFPRPPTSNSTPSTNTTPTTTPVPVVQAPRLGGVVCLDGTTPTPWLGGQPHHSWWRLDSSSTTHQSPTQLRPLGPSSSIKGAASRVKGLETPFSANNKKHSFHYFCHKVWEHMVKHGLDTVAYLPHPSKPLTTFSVVKVTSQHTVDTARLEMEKIKMKWDSYSQASNREAVEFLMNSLDPRTEQMILDNKQEEDDTFVVLWKVLQRGIMSISITRYAEIKDKIKALEPSQYPGHNILMMVIQLKEWCQELQDADQYDHYLTLIITKNFLKGGGATNELWRMPFLLLIPKLNDALLEIPHMSRETAWAHMKGEKLLWTHVCEQARNEYRMMLDNKEWPPQRSHRDSRRPHHRFGHPAITQDKSHSQAQANALIQHTQASGQGSATCHGCGKA